MNPTRIPPNLAHFSEWVAEKAPQAEFWAIFTCDKNIDNNNFCALLKNLKVPFRATGMGKSIIAFYNSEQNRSMLVGVKLAGIVVGLVGWGPLDEKLIREIEGEAEHEHDGDSREDVLLLRESSGRVSEEVDDDDARPEDQAGSFGLQDGPRESTE